jgi:MYXO-CTERM domain-containing protein
MDAGGGIETVLGNLFLSNVTITSNTADSDGSGGAGNGGGILTFGTEGTIENTIIAGNIDESPAAENPDCFNGSVNVVSDGNNIIGIGPCNNFEDGTNGDQVGTTEAPINALLGPLGDNGGPTPTHSLLENSPAIDTGNPDGCFAGGTELDTDQRGFTRPADGNEDGAPICDIGAFEVSCGDTVLQTFAGEQCDDGNNENGDGCSADCQDEDGGPVCGNGDCEDGEDEISCPADCAGVPDCGNGICDAGEDADNCSQDCEEEGDGGCSLATTASSSANYAALALPLLAVGGIWLRRRRSK